MERTIWMELDVNTFLYHVESIKFYEKEMIEEKGSKFELRARELRDRHIKAVQRDVKKLKGTDFTAALDIIKEEFPGRQHELTGYYNF